MHSLTTASRCLLPSVLWVESLATRTATEHRKQPASLQRHRVVAGWCGDKWGIWSQTWSRCRLARRDTCDRTRGGMPEDADRRKIPSVSGRSAAVLFSLLPWESCPPSQVVLCYTEWLNSSKARVGNSKLSDWLVAIAETRIYSKRVLIHEFLITNRSSWSRHQGNAISCLSHACTSTHDNIVCWRAQWWYKQVYTSMGNSQRQYDVHCDDAITPISKFA